MVSYEHWPEAKVLRRIRLGPLHLPTGQARHVSDGQLLPSPAELIIARHDSVTRSSILEPERPSSSYYIFYIDEQGEELTDLCEQTLDDALAQAEAEFGIEPGEWSIIDEDDSETTSTSH